MRIALDAMGGDHAPRETVHGALRAVADDPQIHVTLIGLEEQIHGELDAAGKSDDGRIDVVHASEVIESHESPADALRKKRDSSVLKCFQLCQTGEADAMVSAGNTGAVVGAATFVWRLIPGVRKTGIAVALGTRDKHTVVCDVGANIHCKPLHLLHYGMMASLYSERVLGHEKPRVALLNIGTEDVKGNQLVKETHELFERAQFNFVGHVEGTDVFTDKADVIVCEGFVGNVVLKVCEGLSEAMHDSFDEIIGAHIGEMDATSAAFAQLVNRFRKATDYAEVGGAALLGRRHRRRRHPRADRAAQAQARGAHPCADELGTGAAGRGTWPGVPGA